MSFQPASLIGFGLLFAALCFAGSFLAAAAIRLARPVFVKLGPRVERVAAALALVGPPVIASLLTLILMGASFTANLGPAEDHCGVHDHHLHLCLVHGGAWSHGTPPAVILAVLSALIAIRLARAAHIALRAKRDFKVLQAASEPAGVERGFNVRLIESEQAFCVLSASHPPSLIAGKKAWSSLDDDERAAVIEHERAHLDQRDSIFGPIFTAASAFGLPLFSGWILSRWRVATEQSCDRAAASIVSAEAVASALVRLARLAFDHRRAQLAASFYRSPRETEKRIEALLAGGPEGRSAAQVLLGSALLSSIAICAGAAVLSEPLHHLFESLLHLHLI